MFDFSEKRYEDRLFFVEKGEDFLSIAASLEEEGLISSKYSFIAYNVINRTFNKLQAGEYSLSSSMSVKEISEKLVKGDVAKRRLTIVEGWNMEDIGEYLEKENLCSKEEFLKLASRGENFNFLGSVSNLEGYLFPDTYEILLREDCSDLISKMLGNFKEKIKSQNIEDKEISKIVNMASLIEKEVRTFEDKKLVSGVLWKRLEAGMPLQVDATIAYITGKKTSRISLEELKIDSPYNTYKYKGLPVSPISNPGIESIAAAAYPEESDYWFYLSAPDGKTIFSRNLKEHNIAKNKYLK